MPFSPCLLPPIGDHMNYGGTRLFDNGPWYDVFGWNDNECTTAFGAWSSAGGGTWADLTAGHCYLASGGGWTVWPSGSVQSYNAVSAGGYQDRVFMESPQVSYWTWTGSGTGWQDMSSNPGHIYNGAYYCHFSREQYGRRCGNIQGVNHVVTDSSLGITVFTTRGNAAQGMLCTSGDSGGPVFQPRLYAEYWVSGTIEAGNLTTDECRYLALDDQMAGSGFSLL